MDLQLIVDFIVQEITGFLGTQEQKALPIWLNRLKIVDTDTKRLLICLGIDIKYDLIDRNVLVGVITEALTNYDFVGLPPPIDCFEEAAKKIDLIACSVCKDPDHSGSSYANVMVWGKFHKTVLTQLHETDSTVLDYESYRTSARHSIELAAEMHDNMVELAGNNNIVWVAPILEIEDAIKNQPAILVAGHLADKYGLPMRSGKNEYLALYYPAGHEVHCVQPTSISADWKWPEGLFLSYKKEDNYGRTFSVQSGTSNSGKERIHSKLSIKFTDLQKVFLGDAGVLNKDTTHLLSAGFNRWDK